MKFATAHATHPDWRMALSLATSTLAEQKQFDAAAATLGFVYLTDGLAGHAEALIAALNERFPGVAWVGSVGVGVAASGVEYIDEPALVLMLCDLPRTQFRVFSGRQPLAAGAVGQPRGTVPFGPHTALVHAEAHTPDLAELIEDLSLRTGSGYLFGGLVSSRTRSLHFADGVLDGALSGVAFSAQVDLRSRVTQGCQPIGPLRRVTSANDHVLLELDGRPALDVLLEDLGTRDESPAALVPRLRQTLAGIADAGAASLARPGQFGQDTRVRHVIGLDPRKRGIAIAHRLEAGMQLAFCQRDVQAARRDLVRICTELRDAVESAPLPADATTAAGAEAGAPARRIAGALYISCAGRGGPHFGGPSAELQIVRHALGDVPLAGFFASGEIGHHHVYGYTGVLTIFVE